MSIWPKLAALAVVLHEGKLLLVRRKHEPDANLWGFPGGHVDAGETVLQAAARELREETTVVATPTEYLKNLDIIIRDENSQIAFHYLLVSVLCEYEAGHPRALDDVYEAGWFDVGTVLGKTLPMSEDVDTVLLAAMDRLGL